MAADQTKLEFGICLDDPQPDADVHAEWLVSDVVKRFPKDHGSKDFGNYPSESVDPAVEY